MFPVLAGQRLGCDSPDHSCYRGAMNGHEPALVRLRANSPVRILGRDGWQVGTLLVIEGSRALIELPEPLVAGAVTEMNVDLGAILGTARCEVTAGAELLTAADECRRQRFVISAVAGADRELWESWHSFLVNGGQFTEVSGFSTPWSVHEVGAASPRELTSAALRQANLRRLLLSNAPIVPEEDLVEVFATDGDPD